MSTSKWPSEPQFCERWRYIWRKNGQKRSYNSYLRVTFVSKHSLVHSVLWENSRIPQRPFKIIWPLTSINKWLKTTQSIFGLKTPLLRHHYLDHILLFLKNVKLFLLIFVLNECFADTVKLGIKELLSKEQFGFNELFTDYQLFYTINLSGILEAEIFGRKRRFSAFGLRFWPPKLKAEYGQNSRKALDFLLLSKLPKLYKKNLLTFT